MERELWTVAQTAEHLGCSEDTVRRLIRAGKIPAVNISARLTRVFPEDVEIYLRSRGAQVAELQRKSKGRTSRVVPLGGVNNSGYYPGMKVV